MMVEQLVSLWTLIFILDHLFHVLRKPIFMALCSSNSAPSPSPLTWKRLSQSPVFASKKVRDIPRGSLKEESLSSSLKLISEALGVGKEEGFDQEKSDECVVAKAMPMPPAAPAARRLWKRPVKIVIPPNGGGDGGSGFGESGFRREEDVGREMEVEGSDYCLASKRGTRHMMEDGYGVITNINGDSKQAFFGVFDGHGGRAAVDFISDKLGKNIISSVDEIKEEDGENSMTMAIKAGYLTTDSEFLHKGLSSGACAATVLLKNGEMHVSNVGDCRIVMSRNGLAEALTTDHRPGREDERIRIENLGGYVNCHNGVWRVQDSLAISRSIGDANMKEWIVSEPETKRIPLTQDCEFLIIASDGLWDKVSNQEAVDLVGKMRKSIQSCKDLVEVSCSRGNRDDITVMVVDIRSFSRAG